jgi:hypothetical protein
MSTPSGPDAGSRAPRAGLCDRCAHQQLVHNTRGSTFSLCRRSREDPAYPRYPPIPVLECPGYTPSGALRELGAPGGGAG